MQGVPTGKGAARKQKENGVMHWFENWVDCAVSTGCGVRAHSPAASERLSAVAVNAFMAELSLEMSIKYGNILAVRRSSGNAGKGQV